ncbi:hypothetical protein Tco_0724174 [Tanacetum coccineum]
MKLLGNIQPLGETSTTSNDDFWKNQEDWEIVRWRLNESSGVHTLELEDGTMIHMLTERRYPLSRELMKQEANQWSRKLKMKVNNAIT